MCDITEVTHVEISQNGERIPNECLTFVDPIDAKVYVEFLFLQDRRNGRLGMTYSIETRELIKPFGATRYLLAKKVHPNAD